MTHRGFRQEFGLLATAAKGIRGDTHRALVEEQLALCLEVLHHHHAEEDNWVFPTLRSRATDALPGLISLSADHEQLHALIEAVSKTETPLEERAQSLQEMHVLLNEHLEREERDAIPLIAEHITAEEWEQSSKRMLGTISKEKMPLIVGWLANASTPEQNKQAMRLLAPPARLLFRFVWKPAYGQRFAALYR